MSLPVLPVELTKNEITVELAKFDIDLLQEFQEFCFNNLKFPYGQLVTKEVRTQWQLFSASKQVVTVTVEEKETTEEDETETKLHNIVFNGVSIRDQQVRKSDHIDKNGYLNWLEENKNDLENWLQSIRDEPTFQDPNYLKHEIPTNQPLYICVDWKPEKYYDNDGEPSLNKLGELRMFKAKDLIIRGRGALSSSRSSLSPLTYNSSESFSDSQSVFFHKPYVEVRTPDYKYTDKHGNDLVVTKIDMKRGDKYVPNHAWTSCIIQSADRQTTYFSFQTLKSQVKQDKKEKQFITRTGFEGFQAQMHSGGYSDIFTTYLNKMNPDGTPLTRNGAVVLRKCDVRFRIAVKKLNCDSLTSTARGLSHADTGKQENGSVDKTNNVYLDVRTKEGTWEESYVIGRAHFSSMAAVYQAVECSNITDNYKAIVKQKGRHILKLMADPCDKTREIQAECKKFVGCNLVYQNDILYTRRNKGKNIYGIEELAPLFRRTIVNHTPVVFLQQNPDSVKLLAQLKDVLKHCDKWLYKNHEKWLVLEVPKQPRKKAATAKHCLKNRLRFMVKQTLRWGNPIFTDTETRQTPTEEIIHTILTGATVGLLDIKGENWLKCRYDLLKQFAKLHLGEDYWDSLNDRQKKDVVEKVKLQFNVNDPSDLFSPANIGLAGNPPHPTWFRLIESFYKAIGDGIIYTHYGDVK